MSKLLVAANKNNVLHRFWQTGVYEKHAIHGNAGEGGLAEDGVKAHRSGVEETLSSAMSIFLSSF